ncbi:hypothetical protein CIG75_18630 [Tumebacillus algifaecis]|uniref:Nitrous oxide reductase n=1 Tax=Tumebacillus algifaecis TaxID=1214604 RepID=A0A223D5R6_9BACL|nr:nitrous oxide reductase accessory protein NosL [Tumebacillus algifaecis]ASS76756.1 hypothetical protein CIG75_18630 [Tumebacillus algifaecis]
MKKQNLLFTALAALLISTTLSGCGTKEVQPVAVDEKVDKCAICNMLVKDDKFAVELVQENGKAMKFDDIGCLFAWAAKNGTDQVQQQFVRDYNTDEWVKIEKAAYVFHKDIMTPMAYNVISFKEKADAEAFLKQHGQGSLLTYDDLTKHSWEMNKEMMKEKMEHNHSGSGMSGM